MRTIASMFHQCLNPMEPFIMFEHKAHAMALTYGKIPKEHIADKVKAGNIDKKDGALLLKFLDDTITTKNVTPETVSSYCRYLVIGMELIGKPVRSWNYQDFAKFSTSIKEKYAPNTSRKHVMMMRVFFLYLIEHKIIKNIKADQLQRVKLPRPNRMTKKAGDMLSIDEIKAIIGGAHNSRDRAIISILFESGCRPIEILSLTWGDVSFDKYGCVINTSKKTGVPRRIRVIHATPHLIKWKEDYPNVPEGHASVFVAMDTDDHHSLGRGGLRRLLAKAVKNAGIENKRVHPYLLRHSRVTNMLSESISTAVISLQMWGSLDSQMLKTYGHLSDVQSDNILLAHAGLLDKKEKSPDLKPLKCPSCDKNNPVGLKFCGVCGSTLDPIEYQKKIQTSPEALLEKMKEQMELLDHILKSGLVNIVPKTLPSGEEIYDLIDKK